MTKSNVQYNNISSLFFAILFEKSVTTNDKQLETCFCDQQEFAASESDNISTSENKILIFEKRKRCGGDNPCGSVWFCSVTANLIIHCGGMLMTIFVKT